MRGSTRKGADLQFGRAVLGGPETRYPEYRKKLKDKYVPPPPVTAGRGGERRRRSWDQANRL